ncbi:YndJ family protein [Viridibacillus sp. YIM B01967]|uniref:YndJ family protein n=1 Tax=Viridibacillus soli TaxID=2798301 RepID=A0ABS1HCI5_9BACL|nr:YndJ family protein [Viridibacillus soli]MBK3497161.1 YndJ family protein [Viridibacillus soli]
MQVNSKNTFVSLITIVGIILFVASGLFTKQQPFFLMLTAAQLLFVPMMLQQVIMIRKIHCFFIFSGMISIFLLHIVSSGPWSIVLVLIYVTFTLFVAVLGAERFLRRGFTNWEEISIDIGMMYLFIGGLWFFAYIAGLDTGFSPLITWLTGIHFHYSAFLLCISLGFFGRLHDSKLYRWIVPMILAGPMLVAIGITFWPVLEVISVLVYIFAIYSLIVLAFQTHFATRLQAVCIRLSFIALGVTILFSFLYATGNAFGEWTIRMDFMLAFHGFFNCVIFGLIGVGGWAMSPPKTNQRTWDFPISQICGKLEGIGDSHPGLVDDLSVFVDTEALPKTIIEFYEQTDRYQLFASIKWAVWFKPFAMIYKLVSKQMQQLNLPISSKETEMTGEIKRIDTIVDGRVKPRAWIRKVQQQTVFVAIYSQHKTAGRSYMNIALPLPLSSMIGILQIDEKNGCLILTSEGEEDAGIYLTVGQFLFKLPLSEHFTITETSKGNLTALHKMKIFGIPFLRIDYRILRK